MPATIVVGGQFGSEGKGKVVALLADRSKAPWLVRCGGPNSGHTITASGQNIVLRQVPSCVSPQRAMFCISAACVVDEDILIRELDQLGIARDRIIVDPRAVLLAPEDVAAERREIGTIGSTCSGNGNALMRRMRRGQDVGLAANSNRIKERCRVELVAPLLHNALDSQEDVIVEGTQGFALSLFHGANYPYLTSRDTTAAAFAAEVGLSPRRIAEIVMVIRTYPIRVSGPSGPLKDEISWDEIRRRSNAPATVPELTSVTKRVRRVAKFNLDDVLTACEYNSPTRLAVMGLDRLDYAMSRVSDSKHLTDAAWQFLKTLEDATGIPIEFAGTGFETYDVVERPTRPERLHSLSFGTSLSHV
jgi:adenylosuccinate synthase